MPCIRIQSTRTALGSTNPLDILGVFSQILANSLGGDAHYILSMWEPIYSPTALSRIDVLGIAPSDCPNLGALRLSLEQRALDVGLSSNLGLSVDILDGERSDWDNWEAGAVDGFRIVYGLYQAGRAVQ